MSESAVAGNDFEKLFSVPFQLDLPYAVHSEEFFLVGRLGTAHLHQRRIAENDIGRHTGLFSQVTTQLTQLFEQLLVRWTQFQGDSRFFFSPFP